MQSSTYIPTEYEVVEPCYCILDISNSNARPLESWYTGGKKHFHNCITAVWSTSAMPCSGRGSFNTYYWDYMRIDSGLLTNPTSSVIIPPLAHLFLFFFSPSLQSSLSSFLLLCLSLSLFLSALQTPGSCTVYTLRSELYQSTLLHFSWSEGN